MKDVKNLKISIEKKSKQINAMQLILKSIKKCQERKENKNELYEIEDLIS